MYETRLITNQYSSLYREDEGSERNKKETKKQFIGYELTYLFFHIIARFFIPLAKDSAFDKRTRSCLDFIVALQTNEIRCISLVVTFSTVKNSITARCSNLVDIVFNVERAFKLVVNTEEAMQLQTERSCFRCFRSPVTREHALFIDLASCKIK